jgi:hypothetical protein
MRRKYIIRAILICGFILISIFGIRWTIRFFQIDACLDIGCVWNYKLNKCENCYDLNTAGTEFYWHAEYDSILNKEFLIKGRLIDSIGRYPSQLVEILNKRNLKCKIEKIDLNEDTIIIRIINDEFLTEQMGTDGAHCFLGETVFTLTENDRIKHVRIKMDYGSHASPGIYTRDDFNDLIRSQ